MADMSKYPYPDHKFKIGDKVKTNQFAGIVTSLPIAKGLEYGLYKVELFPGQGWPTEYVFVNEEDLEKVA
jgi:2-keto-3-deoxy-6-phosphogluconate aldolase